jgi:outer membrane protein OmpA-like peptidoglycan-associated protein
MFSISNAKGPAFAAVLAAAVAGCASTPSQNPQISAIEASLAAAYGNKFTAEHGQADLMKAETSLAAARIADRKGRNGEFQHEITMAENYVALGRIHGDQARTIAETAFERDRQDQIRLASRDRDVRRANNRADMSDAEAAAANAATDSANNRADASQADAVAANAATDNANDRAQNSRADAITAKNDARIANDLALTSQADAVAANAATANANDRAQNSRADALTAKNDARIANNRALSSQAETAVAVAGQQSAEAKLAAMQSQLSMYDMKYTALGATLVLRDVMFTVDSSLLLPGSITRLEPLIAYLRASPSTSVTIEGHTDNSGTVAHNNTLSLDRANSVRRALSADSGVSNAMETKGYGQDKPVATNATVSGREQNRRVEITLQ